MGSLGRTGVIVQMRLDSTRLPRKALLPLAGSTLAGAVMARLSRVKADVRVLATDADGADALGPLAESMGYLTFAGPKDDVLLRFRLAAERHGVDTIIRATGDNPLVSYELADALSERACETNADYAGYTGMPVGFGVEVIRFEALAAADALATSPYDREHVCPYLYGHPERFNVDRPACPATHAMPDARVTVDTGADYERVSRMFGDLGPDPTDADVLGWLAAEARA